MSERLDRDKVEELLYAIQQASHTECHLLEVHEKNFNKGDLTGFIKRARETRRVLMNELMIMFEDTGADAVWCVIKHSLTTHFHLLELFEKDYEKVYIEQAREVYLLINDLLNFEYHDFKNCARCDGDRGELSLYIAPTPEPIGSPVYLTEVNGEFKATTIEPVKTSIVTSSIHGIPSTVIDI